MKKFLHLLIFNSQFLIFNSSAQSPNWLWAKSMGGTGSDGGYSITVDASCNVYTTGYFTGTVDFDPGAGVFNLTGSGTFISKLDSSGNFIWAKAIGGTALGGIGPSIALDTAGSMNVYTTGSFWGTTDFDPGAGVFNLTAVGVSYDIYIVRLDSSGNFVWAKAMGGTNNDRGTYIAIDPVGNGDVYTTGDFEGIVDFDPGAGIFNLTSVGGGYNIFISKLDSSGNFIWAKAMGGMGYSQAPFMAIDPAGSGDVYTTGHFGGTVDFDPGAGVFNLTSAGYDDIFISKLDSSGNFVWAKAMGGTDYDDGRSIVIDPAGSGAVYAAGYFYSTVDFDPGIGVFNLTSDGGWDIFISKLDAAGNFLWAKRMGGSGWDYGMSMAIDPAGIGGVYTTGWFGGIVDFDPDSSGSLNLTSAGGSDDIFISKLDGSGNFVWAKAIGGTDADYGLSITLDASGHAYVTGGFESPTISFGSTTLINAGNTGSAPDIFIARLDTSVVTGIDAVSATLNMTAIFPNPFSYSTTISFSLSQSQNVSLNIFDVNGRLIVTLADKLFEEGEHYIEFNAENLDAGIYFLKMQVGEFMSAKMLIVTN